MMFKQLRVHENLIKNIVFNTCNAKFWVCPVLIESSCPWWGHAWRKCQSETWGEHKTQSVCQTKTKSCKNSYQSSACYWYFLSQSWQRQCLKLWTLNRFNRFSRNSLKLHTASDCLFFFNFLSTAKLGDNMFGSIRPFEPFDLWPWSSNSLSSASATRSR